MPVCCVSACTECFRIILAVFNHHLEALRHVTTLLGHDFHEKSSLKLDYILLSTHRCTVVDLLIFRNSATVHGIVQCYRECLQPQKSIWLLRTAGLRDLQYRILIFCFRAELQSVICLRNHEHPTSDPPPTV